MRERKRINKAHPRYGEYIKKCEKLAEAFDSQEAEILTRSREWHGLDNPADEEINPIREKYHADLKKLQEEYSFLFV